MSDVDLLKQFVDEEEDFIVDSPGVCFTRHGKTYELELRRTTGVGNTVVFANGKEENCTIQEYIIKELLELQILSSQITKSITRKRKKAGIRYVDGPATVNKNAHDEKMVSSKGELLSCLQEALPFNTQIVRLTAAAGQGKTVLLEEVALKLAQQFVISAYPQPLLLPIDLLGRYVGTIDDAIAGSLNNTYEFPRLSQRDVIACLRQNWLCLALDGFDELCARVGARDAFTKITDLLDQLDGNGSIILSARDTFFDLHNITFSIQSYMRPRKGTFATVVFDLCDWEESHGIKVFENISSENPRGDYQQLCTAFGQESRLLKSPFFLTKISTLWYEKGERFSELANDSDEQSRINFILETYIKREAQEKWIDENGEPFIPETAHTQILGVIAEEMWRASSFCLASDELKIACEMSLDGVAINKETQEAVIERIPTHAVFQTTNNKMFSFSHDQFFYYYLGHQIARYIIRGEVDAFVNILSERQLGPVLIGWIEWAINAPKQSIKREVLIALQKITINTSSVFLKYNIGYLISILIGRIQDGEAITLNECEFSDDCLKSKRIVNVLFNNCKFWDTDFSSTSLRDCQFKSTSLYGLAINDETDFSGTFFDTETTIHSVTSKLEEEEKEEVFSPESIKEILKAKGGAFPEIEVETEGRTIAITKNASRAIRKFIAKSNKFYTVSVSEIEEEVGSICVDIAKTGIDAGVFREKTISSVNSRLPFVVISCDKNDLTAGQHKKVKDNRINEFWKTIGERYPA